MATKLMIAVGVAALTLLISGCGYKAPPYYEKPIPVQEHPVAL